jgi:hypothetical protein
MPDPTLDEHNASARTEDEAFDPAWPQEKKNAWAAAGAKAYRHSSLPDWAGACVDLSPSRQRADAYLTSLRLDEANEEFREALRRNACVAARRKAVDAVRVLACAATNSVETPTRSLQ